MGRQIRQMITFNDGRFMVNSQGFVENINIPIPSNNRCMTKSDILSEFKNLDESLLNEYASNQLVPYDKLNTLAVAWRGINYNCVQDDSVPLNVTLTGFTEINTSGDSISSYISASISGGVPNYTYQFSNGVSYNNVSDLSKTTSLNISFDSGSYYSVTVTDLEGTTAFDSIGTQPIP